MRKLGIILAITVVGLMIAASAAFAMEAPYTHGDFSSNSKGCADCHVTHAADAAKLLVGGNGTQTSFCLVCHGNDCTGSPFDVYYGKMVFDSAFTPSPRSASWADPSVIAYSYSGGFKTAFDFWDTDLPGKAVTSMHNVRGAQTAFGPAPDIANYQYDLGNQIPGATSAAGIDFECGSCHNPHAGGKYDNDQADKNPRLLKEVLPASGATRRVMMQFDQPTNTVKQYTYGFNGWCGGCHDIFDTTKAGDGRTGYDKTNGRNKYMHKFGIYVDPTKFAGTDPYKTAYLPLERDPNAGNLTEISCITCHRAHGTAATAEPTNWQRYASYKAYTNSGTTATGSGSALLRLKQRDVCYKCHGEALYNHSVTHSP